MDKSIGMLAIKGDVLEWYKYYVVGKNVKLGTLNHRPPLFLSMNIDGCQLDLSHLQINLLTMQFIEMK